MRIIVLEAFHDNTHTSQLQIVCWESRTSLCLPDPFKNREKSKDSFVKKKLRCAVEEEPLDIGHELQRLHPLCWVDERKAWADLRRCLGAQEPQLRRWNVSCLAELVKRRQFRVDAEARDAVVARRRRSGICCVCGSPTASEATRRRFAPDDLVSRAPPPSS